MKPRYMDGVARRQMSSEQVEVGSRESDLFEVVGGAPGKVLTPAAQRALAEAADRRRAAAALTMAEETGGPAGAEPTRFGDWERKGIAVDF
jgi:hypothetical protein